jgi:ribonuclease HI
MGCYDAGMENTAPLESHLIFCDGSSLGNPGPGGWGAIVVRKEGMVFELGGPENPTTNNRMELKGLIEALKAIDHEEGDVTVYTDSKYVESGATSWYRGWIARGWRTSTNDPVLNADLWKVLLAAISERGKFGRVYWKRVPGHSGVAGNERADAIATGFAKGMPPELFNGSLATYAIDILNIDVDPDLHEERVHDKARSRMKAYSYISEVKGVIQTHATWAECEARVKGKSGVKFKKSLSAAEERLIIAAWSKLK